VRDPGFWTSSLDVLRGHIDDYSRIAATTGPPSRG
jgi:hypothetical protein